MVILLYAFLIGCICGLRSMTAPAVVAWGAHLGWLHLQGSLLAFLAQPVSLVVFSVFALGELIADKLPFIPARTAAGPLAVRVIFGALCGAGMCISSAASVPLGALLGGLGGVAGAFAGYTYRRRLAALARDLLLAVGEDLVAIGGGLFLISR
jgi:uncharacterized membrane protein